MFNRSHTVVLAFALVFVMGMAFAVAMLCLPRSDKADEPIAESVGTDGEVTEAQTQTSTQPPDRFFAPESSNGLEYRSFGDGTCTLAGIGTCVDACVVIPEFAPNGDRVTEISARAFYGVATVTAVQIPASVRNIGQLAFSACRNLMYISVSKDNTAFCDGEGVLYTADRGTLLVYPAMRAGSVAVLSSETVRIADMAFYGCVYLTEIRFEGTAEAWEAIAIGSKNYSLTACAKQFLSTEEG